VCFLFSNSGTSALNKIKQLLFHSFENMHRREFIKTTGLAIPSFSSLPILLSSCNRDDDPIDTDKKVLIIGAGISGLAAAKYLKGRKVDAVVLEAQDRVGGRLKTDWSQGVAFDEGASWIHGPKKNPITELAEEAGCKTFFTDDEKLDIYDIDGKVYDEDKAESAEKAFSKLLGNLKGTKDQSFAEVLYAEHPNYKDDRFWTYMLSAYLEFDTGADINELSALDYYDDSEFSGDDLIITNGYDRIPQKLAEGIDIRLNTVVQSIDYSKDLVKVITKGETFEAHYVIITVPLGVLKQGDIGFTPTLPDNLQSSISALMMGTVNKYLCIWDEVFWDNDLQYIGYTPQEKGKFNYFLNVKKFADANGLMTFTFGDYSRQAEGKSDAEIIAEIMDHLKTIYGDDIPEPTTLLRTRWNEDPWTYGSYSFVARGARSSDFERFEETVEGKLFFAGEHTTSDYRGTVHGAYLSGVREGEKLAEVLEKPA